MANRKNKYATTRKSNELSSSQYLGLLALSTVVCFLYILRQYNCTIVPFDRIAYFFITIGLLGSAVSFKLLPSSGTSYRELLQTIGMRVILFGSLLTSLVFLTNTYLTNEKPYRVTTSIKEKHKGYSSRNNTPYVIAELEGFEKRIYIHEHPFEEMVEKDDITLKLRKGFWGFLIIDYESIQIK